MDRKHDTRLTIALCALVALLTLAVFGSVVHHDFVDYDDQDYVTARLKLYETGQPYRQP